MDAAARGPTVHCAKVKYLILERPRPRPLPGVLAASCVLAVTAPAMPAAAHPFGDPQTARIEMDGRVVSIRWHAAEDDLTSLALMLDLVPGPRRYVFRDGAMVPERSDESDVAALAEAPELGDYLLERIGVSQSAQACPGLLLPVADLASDGAVVEFTCPAPVEEVEVRLATLTDLHPAYKVMATGPGGQGGTFSFDSDTRAFTADHDGSGDLARSGRTLAALGAGGVVLLAAGALVRRRRRTRKFV